MTSLQAMTFNPDDLQWHKASVRGIPLDEAPVLKGEDGIYSAFYRLPAGTLIKKHKHRNWVQVLVLEGSMAVETDGETRIVTAGGCYVAPASGIHIETATTDSLVFVVSPDP